MSTQHYAQVASNLRSMLRPMSENVVPETAPPMYENPYAVVTQTEPAKTGETTALWKIIIRISILIMVVMMSLLIVLMVRIGKLEGGEDMTRMHSSDLTIVDGVIKLNDVSPLFNILQSFERHEIKDLNRKIQTAVLKINDILPRMDSMKNSIEEVRQMVVQYQGVAQGVTQGVTHGGKAAAHPTVRLVGGDASSGRVEILHDGEWGTICDDYWDSNDAQVICRMLGFHGDAEAHYSAHHGEGYGPIWLDGIHCIGYEADIVHCDHSEWGIHDCTHFEDVSVTCH